MDWSVIQFCQKRSMEYTEHSIARFWMDCILDCILRTVWLILYNWHSWPCWDSEQMLIQYDISTSYDIKKSSTSWWAVFSVQLCSIQSWVYSYPSIQFHPEAINGVVQSYSSVDHASGWCCILDHIMNTSWTHTHTYCTTATVLSWHVVVQYTAVHASGWSVSLCSTLRSVIQTNH